MKDMYGREINYLRISVTERCDLCCRYCRPGNACPALSEEQLLSDEEIIRAVKAAASCGIRKIRITGGEPMMREGIPDLVRQIRNVEGIGEVVMTTNGRRLNGNAKQLLEAGVSRLNISLDTLDEKKYEWITKGGQLEPVLNGIEEALQAGFEKIKLNTVLIRGFNEDEAVRIAGLTMEKPVDVRFIELMPMTQTVEFGPEAYISCGEILSKMPELRLRDTDGVSVRYRFPNAEGCVGLICPVSEPFCAVCNRLRLTADGKIRPCLHSPLEYRIKGMSLEEMIKQFQEAVSHKPVSHGGIGCGRLSAAGREMFRIGG